METRILRTTLFGRNVNFPYSEKAVGYAILLLRIVMGWTFLQAGLTKLVDPGWTAAGYLTHLPEGNPFMGVFAAMAGSPIVDFLVVWGLVLVGFCLIIGLAVRLSSFVGAIMMLLFWASSLTGGILQFLPVEHGWIVDDHLVYAAILFGLGAFGTGRILGVDGWLKERFFEDAYWFDWLVG